MTEPSANTDSRRTRTRWRSGLFHVRGPALDPRVGITAIVALAGVVAICCAVAWNGDVPGWEQATLKFFNGWPDWLEPAMWVIQQPGVLFFPYAVGALIVPEMRAGSTMRSPSCARRYKSRPACALSSRDNITSVRKSTE